jgi:hypothetical protein
VYTFLEAVLKMEIGGRWQGERSDALGILERKDRVESMRAYKLVGRWGSFWKWGPSPDSNIAGEL